MKRTAKKKLVVRPSLVAKTTGAPASTWSDEELAAVIRFDPATILAADGLLKRLQDLTWEQRMAIADVEIDTRSGRIRRADFKSKLDAIEEYFRRIGRGDDPEIVEQLKVARQKKQRGIEFEKAMKAMRENDRQGTLN